MVIDGRSANGRSGTSDTSDLCACSNPICANTVNKLVKHDIMRSPTGISATFLRDLVVRANIPDISAEVAPLDLLSPLDLAFAGAGAVSQTFYFSERLDAARLVEGLSAALDQFPMFAGRLTTVSL